MKKNTFFVVLLFISVTLHAQKEQNPVWYTMMRDPKVNYYEAVKAYQDYWKDKRMPPNKEQRLTEEYKAFFAKMAEPEREEYERVFILNKEFKNWMVEEASWVQPDGHVLSDDEKMAIIAQQQRELKAIEKKKN